MRPVGKAGLSLLQFVIHEIMKFPDITDIQCLHGVTSIDVSISNAEALWSLIVWLLN